MLSRRTFKTMLIILIALTLSGFTYAFAAANTFPASTKAGSGAVTISGYDVTGIQYTLNASNPANIDSVSFTLDAAASTVKASVVAPASYVDCSNGGSGNTWTCNLTSTSVLSATSLSVIAAQ
jgi:hypothetical protein